MWWIHKGPSSASGGAGVGAAAKSWLFPRSLGEEMGGRESLLVMDSSRRTSLTWDSRIDRRALRTWMSPFSSSLAWCSMACRSVCSDGGGTEGCLSESAPGVCSKGFFSAGLRSMGLFSKELLESPARSMRTVMPLSQESVLCMAPFSTPSSPARVPPSALSISSASCFFSGASGCWERCDPLGPSSSLCGGAVEAAFRNLAQPRAPLQPETLPAAGPPSEAAPGAGLLTFWPSPASLLQRFSDSSAEANGGAAALPAVLSWWCCGSTWTQFWWLCAAASPGVWASFCCLNFWKSLRTGWSSGMVRDTSVLWRSCSLFTSAIFLKMNWRRRRTHEETEASTRLQPQNKHKGVIQQEKRRWKGHRDFESARSCTIRKQKSGVGTNSV